MQKRWGVLIALLVFGVGGCTQVKHHSQKPKVVTKKSNKRTLDFTVGTPEQLQKTYHQYFVGKSDDGDQLAELTIKKHKMVLNDLTSGQREDYLENISYYQLKKNNYMLYDGLSFQKVQVLANQDLKLFDSNGDYQAALKTSENQLYHVGALPKKLRLSPIDLDTKSYVNSADFRDYISFNTGYRNSYEAVVQNDGTLQYPRYFQPEILIKNGKYVLKTLDLNDSTTEHYVTFSKISATSLRDDTTGQVYYLEQNPKQKAFEKMGIEIPTTKYQQSKSDKKEAKTYDFADDQDDDYYDTYDDFDLNEGD